MVLSKLKGEENGKEQKNIMDIAGSLVGIVVYRAVLDVFCHFSRGWGRDWKFLGLSF